MPRLSHTSLSIYIVLSVTLVCLVVSSVVDAISGVFGCTLVAVCGLYVSHDGLCVGVGLDCVFFCAARGDRHGCVGQLYQSQHCDAIHCLHSLRHSHFNVLSLEPQRLGSGLCPPLLRLCRPLGCLGLFWTQTLVPLTNHPHLDDATRKQKTKRRRLGLFHVVRHHPVGQQPAPSQQQ